MDIMGNYILVLGKFSSLSWCSAPPPRAAPPLGVAPPLSLFVIWSCGSPPPSLQSRRRQTSCLPRGRWRRGPVLLLSSCRLRRGGCIGCFDGGWSRLRLPAGSGEVLLGSAVLR